MKMYLYNRHQNLNIRMLQIKMIEFFSLVVFFSHLLWSFDQTKHYQRFGVEWDVLHCPSWGFIPNSKWGTYLWSQVHRGTLQAKGTEMTLTLTCPSARKCTSLTKGFYYAYFKQKKKLCGRVERTRGISFDQFGDDIRLASSTYKKKTS